MFHASQAVLALSREENPTTYQKTLGLNDFYFGADGEEFPLGNIQMVGKSQAPMFKRREADRDEARAGLVAGARREARDRLLALDRGPAAAPRTASRSTATGRVTLAYTATNDVPKAKLYAKLKSLLGMLDLNPDHLVSRFAYLKNDIPVAGCAHQAGTARFGDDPAASALNRDCRAHEVDNLYVVDTSIFPSIGAVNPALTAMANSIRVGDHLLARMAYAARRRLSAGGRRRRASPRRATSVLDHERAVAVGRVPPRGRASTSSSRRAPRPGRRARRARRPRGAPGSGAGRGTAAARQRSRFGFGSPSARACTYSTPAAFSAAASAVFEKRRRRDEGNSLASIEAPHARLAQRRPVRQARRAARSRSEEPGSGLRRRARARAARTATPAPAAARG